MMTGWSPDVVTHKPLTRCCSARTGRTPLASCHPAPPGERCTVSESTVDDDGPRTPAGMGVLRASVDSNVLSTQYGDERRLSARQRLWQTGPPLVDRVMDLAAVEVEAGVL